MCIVFSFVPLLIVTKTCIILTTSTRVTVLTGFFNRHLNPCCSWVGPKDSYIINYHCVQRLLVNTIRRVIKSLYEGEPRVEGKQCRYSLQHCSPCDLSSSSSLVEYKRKTDDSSRHGTVCTGMKTRIHTVTKIYRYIRKM